MDQHAQACIRRLADAAPPLSVTQVAVLRRVFAEAVGKHTT